MKGPSDCLLYVIASVVLLIVAAPLALGKVKPNRLYGVRTKATLRDPALWNRSNRRFGITLIATGVLYLVAIGYPWATGECLSRTALLVGFLLEVSIPAVIALISGRSRNDSAPAGSGPPQT